MFHQYDFGLLIKEFFWLKARKICLRIEMKNLIGIGK